MPEIGEIKRAKEIGYQSAKWWQKYIYHACVDCGQERWVQLHEGKPRNLRCRGCSKMGARHPLYGVRGEHHPRWKGGEYLRDGYVWVLKPEHPRADKDGYVKRARVVLEQKLGRYLWPNADVHHINGIKDDDRTENLTELFHDEHAALHDENRPRDIKGRFHNELIIAVNAR